ncbi:pectinesterase family protein [Pararhizobium polonicum]|uniref:pectinesterase family protein n=1 Tax=Pararhizobium polonicum TaxID=1612624 RepID=UPI001FCCC6F1|nr:pectinesterase family protein [Pararhizobium polonicum]
MKSGVTLWIDQGAVLAAVSDPYAYDRGSGRCGTIDDKGKGCRPFIQFDGTYGGGIVGDGAIDGRGGETMAGRSETWWQLARRAQAQQGKQNNPRLIEVDNARDITFYRITLRNSPNFHAVLNGVTGATFWGVRIDTPADARNTDGIDPGASQDITIARSFIRTGDDNIAIKAGNGPTRHVSIVDDHFYWGHGVSIGSETNAGVSDILVRDVTLDGTASGLRIKSDASRGGAVSGVLYENICLRNNKKPIDFDTRYDDKAQGSAIPVYSNIVLHNVTARNGALVIHGYDGAHPLSIAFDGVRFGRNVIWQVKNAKLSAGPGGVTPPVPEIAGPTVTDGAIYDCDARWVAFPVAKGLRGDLSPAPNSQMPHARTRDTAILTVGPGKTYDTVQAAADAAKPGDTILIQPGTYREVVHLRTPNLRVAGDGNNADDVVIEADRSARESGGTARSATVFAEADGIEIRQLTIANRFHDRNPGVTEGAQAVALSATGDHQRFVDLRLAGWQDTLYAGSHGCTTAQACKPARQYYQDDVIEGAVDFVFGDALAWFERTQLHGIDRPQVTITAQSRRYPGQPSGYMFHDCTVTADPSVKTISLGRPWQDYATVNYVGCRLDGRVLPQGFTEWQGERRLPTARYLIANASGLGADSKDREPWLLKADATALTSLSSPDSFFNAAE